MSRLVSFLLLRLAAMIPTVLVVMLLGFLLLAFSPGDAVDAYLAQTGGDHDFAARLRESYGFTASLPLRFLSYLAQVIQFDFGRSLVHNRPVIEIILARLPNTLALMAGSFAFASLFGSLLGFIAGAMPRTFAERSVLVIALALFAVPNFWAALLLVLAFALAMPLFPISGTGSISHFVLPSIALGLGYMALYARTLKAGMDEARAHPMVVSAEARGLSRGLILKRYMLRPSLAPLIAVAGQNAATLLGGSIVIESVFAIPGLGLLSYEAVSGRDPFLLTGLLIVTSIMVMLMQMMADALILMLDPRAGGGVDA